MDAVKEDTQRVDVTEVPKSSALLHRAPQLVSGVCADILHLERQYQSEGA